jgi:hypothetical protein
MSNEYRPRNVSCDALRDQVTSTEDDAPARPKSTCRSTCSLPAGARVARVTSAENEIETQVVSGNQL